MIISIGTYLGVYGLMNRKYIGVGRERNMGTGYHIGVCFLYCIRFIPGHRGMYAFNLSTLFGFASVMMTYFELIIIYRIAFAYAAGDPVPIPAFIYYLAAAFLLLGVLAKWKYRFYIIGNSSLNNYPC